MTIPNSKVRDNRVDVFCALYPLGCGGEPTVTRYNTVGSTETTNAVRSRRKPKRLTPTNLSYRERASVCRDTRSGPCMAHNLGTPYRLGTMTYCHNSGTGTRYQFNAEDQVAGARLRALAKASTKYGQFGETLATLPQTSRMISSRLRDIIAISVALKKGNWKQLAKMLKGDVPDRVKRLKPSRRLADGWLELEFGWKPLVQDVYSAIEAYKNRLDVGSMSTQYASSNGGFGKPFYDRIPERGANASVKVYGIVKSSQTVSLNQLGLVNPALIAWQILPFSFVVDWFVPVSSILAALSYRAGLETVYICTTVESGSFRRVSPACCGPFVSVTDRTVHRSVTANPSPFQWKWNPRGFGVWHIATSTALLRQSFR